MEGSCEMSRTERPQIPILIFSVHPGPDTKRQGRQPAGRQSELRAVPDERLTATLNIEDEIKIVGLYFK